MIWRTRVSRLELIGPERLEACNHACALQGCYFQFRLLLPSTQSKLCHTMRNAQTNIKKNSFLSNLKYNLDDLFEFCFLRLLSTAIITGCVCIHSNDRCIFYLLFSFDYVLISLFFFFSRVLYALHTLS
jgi:hypothetical protein